MVMTCTDVVISNANTSGRRLRMATFTNFEIWYHGKAPLGIMSIVRNEMTVSGLLTVGIVEGDSIHI